MQGPKNKASLTSELLLLLLKLCLCKGKRSESIPSITVSAAVGLLFAMNRKVCQEIRSNAISFMDVIFPSNALKYKYLTVVVYFVTVTSSICFNFMLLLHKKTPPSRGQGIHLKCWLYLLCKPQWGARTRLTWLEWPCAQIFGAVQRLHRPMALIRGRYGSGRGRMRVDPFSVISGSEAGWMLYWVRCVICAL